VVSVFERFDDPSPVQPSPDHLDRAMADGRRRVRRRRGGMAMGAVAVLAVVALGSTLFTSAEEDSSVQTVDGPAGWCAVLSEPFAAASTTLGSAPSRAAYDVIVYLEPTTTPERFEQLRQQLEADPEVAEVVPFDQQASYDEFAQLFADSPDMIESVSPSILPSSHRLVLAEGVDPTAVVQRYQDEADVAEVADVGGSGRFVDVLVGPVLVLGPAAPEAASSSWAGTSSPETDAQLAAFEDLAPSDVEAPARTLAAIARGEWEVDATGTDQATALYDAAVAVAAGFERHCGIDAEGEASVDPGTEPAGEGPGAGAEVVAELGPGDYCGLIAARWPIRNRLLGDADWVVEVPEGADASADEVAVRLGSDPDVERFERLDGEAANDAYDMRALWFMGTPWDLDNAAPPTVFRVHVLNPAAWAAATLEGLDVDLVVDAPAEQMLLDQLAQPWVGATEPGPDSLQPIWGEPIDATAEELAPVVAAAPEDLRRDLQVLVDTALSDGQLALEPARAAWAAAARVAAHAAAACDLEVGVMPVVSEVELEQP
jgi:hypothetical protein